MGHDNETGIITKKNKKNKKKTKKITLNHNKFFIDF